MDYSIDGEQVSHSPRTQEKPTEPEVLEKIEHETTDEKPAYYQAQSSEDKREEEPSGFTRFFSLAFYEKYFQISQQEVVERIKLNFLPHKKEFIDKIRANPDLYGPFWILTTIIFLLGSTGNLARYFYNWEKTEYIFKLQLVRYGVVLVYSFGFGVPGLLYMLLKFMKCDSLKLSQLICLYGYSFGCFILIFLVCIIPAGWLHWLLMIYGMINSIAFLVFNLSEYLESLQKKSYVIYGVIGGAQIFLFLMFKLVFFDIIYSE